MSGKRTYTVPVLLVIITLLSFLIIVLYSRMLLDGQSLKTERGERLASSYNYCLAYAGKLQQAAQELESGKDAAGRLTAMATVGQLELAGGECLNTLYQSGIRSGKSAAEAAEAVTPTLQTIWNKLTPIGNHEGALTEQERNSLTSIQAGAKQMFTTLQSYTVPTGVQRYRQMEAGVEWVPIAQQALQQLQQLAQSLS